MERIPPHNIDAEEAVISSLLIGGDINMLTLKPDDFYHEICRFMYEACLSLNEMGTSINQITLAQELLRVNKLEIVGGAAYLSYIISNCPTHIDMPYYAEIVQKLSINRRLILGGLKIEEIGYRADNDIAKSLDDADEIILAVRKQGAPSPIITPRMRADLMSDRYAKLAEEEGGVAIKTGLYDLDYYLGGGLYDGDLIIIGARPSMGKTTFIQYIANQISKTKNVLFCSAEMHVEAVSDRDVAAFAGETIGTIRRGGYTEEVEFKIMHAIGEIDLLNVYYYQDMPLTTEKILQQGIAMQLRFGLGLVAVDYLGMLDDEYGRNAYDRISYISRKLKQIARKLNVPILVAHQLNRALELRSDKRPQLFDLRESGRLEEDADVVIFLYREDYYYTRDEWEREYPAGKDDYTSYPEHIVEVLIAKQRQGQSNISVKTVYDVPHQAYKNLARQATK